MNLPKNSSDINLPNNSKLSSSKISIGPDFFKNIPSNQITINFSKDSNSTEKKKNNENINLKEYIPKYEKEKIEKKKEDSEEEINSDEYVSSTMLDVDTNTYINMTNNIKNNEEKSLNDNNSKNKHNSMHTKGKLRKKNDNNLNYFLLNNLQSLTDEKEPSSDNNNNFNKNTNNNNNKPKKKVQNKNSINNNEKKVKVHHQSNKSDFYINYRPGSINKEKKNDSKNCNSIEQKVIFTPNNESKKKLQNLRDMIIKKLDHYQIKNPYFINQSNTINIIENNDDNKNENEDKIKSLNIDNNINNKNIKLEFESSNKNNRNNKNSRITHNNSITIISNNNKLNTNISEKMNNPQNIQNNNNININIYNKNIIKDIGSLNIDDQKFHIIPQTSKNFKTQGRVEKIVYNNQNKGNNFIYISNNNTNNIINKKKTNSPRNKKYRISPPQSGINSINNMEYYNSICTNKNQKSDENNYLKHINIHSLKNLQSANLQNNIKKYLLEDEYLTIFPLSNDKNNLLEKPRKKLLKEKKTKKITKSKNNKNNEDIKYNQNNFKIKYIMPININANNNKPLRSVNSYYVKKGNQHILNNIQSEQILNTISNNHNKKIDIYNNFKNNCIEMVNNKNSNGLNKRILDEKMKKNRELSFNYAQDNNTIKNLLSLKKIKFLKNKLVLQSPDYYFDKINKDANNNHYKKIKPMITRKKFDLMTEGNKTNLIKNNSKIILPNNNDNIINKSKNNSSVKRIIYIDSNNFKKFNSRPLIYNSLSPNCQSKKHLMDKDKMSNIKEIYNNINNNLGRNTFNIYASSRINPNTNNTNMNNNNNIVGNINDQIIIKKIQKHNIKNNNTKNVTKTINYNNENIFELPNYNLSPQHKKKIVFNNVSNYNINSANNNLNNLTNIKEGQNNNLYKKTIEIFSPFSSINNKKNNINHKKFFVNKQNTQQNNNIITSKDKKSNLLEQNINYLDNNKIKNIFTYTGNNNTNKYLYNKNITNKLNKNDNYNNSNHHIKITSNHYNYNIKTNQSVNNNNFFHFSNSNDKDRNTITNSYGNLYIIKNKNKKKEDKNITLDILEKKQKNKNQKHISPVQELKKRF